MQLRKHLRKNDQGKWWVYYPGEDMKNGEPIDFSFPEDLIPLLEEYLTEDRPIILNGHKNNYVFPTPWEAYLR